MTTLRARVLTPDGPGGIRWIEDGLVAIDDRGHLTEVGPWEGRTVDEDLRPGVLLPGFVDGHVHFPQLRAIGSASGTLLDWLDRSIFPEEGRFASPAHAGAGARRFCSALAAAGTTLSFVYGSVHAEAADILFGALEARGLRALAGPVWMDDNCPANLRVPAAQAVAGLEALAERWHGRDDRLQVAVVPRFALSCSRAMLEAAGGVARDRGLWVSTHLSETTDEVQEACRRFGAADYLAVYEQAGLVHGRSVFAHCIHLSASEWDRMADAGAVVAHCPDSNDFLGSGGMPVAEVLRRDIAVCVGTDVAAGRTFRVPRVLAAAYDNALRTGHPVDAATLLWWGTRGGALALGHPHVGSLSPGLEADMVCVDVPSWVSTPEGVLAWVLLCHDAPPVRRTWVRGRAVWDRDAWREGGGAWPWEGDPGPDPAP